MARGVSAIQIDHDVETALWGARHGRSAQARRLEQEAIARGISRDAVAESVRRVEESRARLDAWVTGKHRADPDPDWAPTRERITKSVLGWDRDAEGRELQRVVTIRPMTLSAMREEVVQWNGGASVTKDTYKRTLTALDKVISGPEREALERYLAGAMLAVGVIRIANYSGMPQGGSDPSSRTPFTDFERREIGGFRYVHARLTMANQRDIDLFVKLMSGDETREAGDEHLHTMGHLVAEYLGGTTDERVIKGGALMLCRKLAQQVAHHYVEYEADVRRIRLDEKNLRGTKKTY